MLFRSDNLGERLSKISEAFKVDIDANVSAHDKEIQRINAKAEAMQREIALRETNRGITETIADALTGNKTTELELQQIETARNSALGAIEAKEQNIADLKQQQLEEEKQAKALADQKASDKQFQSEQAKTIALMRQAVLEELDGVEKVKRERIYAMRDVQNKLDAETNESIKAELRDQLAAIETIYNARLKRADDLERKQIEANDRIEKAYLDSIYKTAQAAQQAQLDLNGGIAQSLTQMTAIINRIARSVERLQ